MPVDIHVLTGSGRLVAHAGRIRAQVRAAAAVAVKHLPLEGGDVDVVVLDDPRMVIEEVSLGGYAPDGHTVFLALDPDHEHFERALEHEVFRMLAHELHHVARRRGSARGHTLLDALVCEGLADHFSTTTPATTTAPDSSAALTSRSRGGRGTRWASRSSPTTSSATRGAAPRRS